jgi:hypothetical protein
MAEYTEAQQELESERRKRVFREYLFSPEYQDRVKLRLQINDACARSAEARAATWNLCARPDNPAEGCIFFIENFGYTFDPRPQAEPHHLPFMLFEYQKDAIRWLFQHIDGGIDGLLEKSRDMGVSWVVFVYVPLWLWLFRDGTNVLVGSYKEDLVDNRSKDSLLGMVDYALDALPKWIQPKGFNKDKHRTHMKLRNPATENMITGDTMNPDFARGSRKTVVLFDELGSWDYAKDAWESAGDSTTCRIANSTPKGYNFYAMLRNSGIDVLTLHWRRHPMKDESWYEYEKQRRTPEEVAQELDISYNKSQEGRIYPDWGDEFVSFGHYPYDDNLPLYVGWDFGGTDDTAIIWLQKHAGKFRIIDTYRNSGKLIEFYVPFITGITPSEGYQYNKKDMECIKAHNGWKRGTHFGDPAGRFRNQVSDKTVISVLQEHGIVVNFQEIWQEFERRKNCTRGLIRSGIQINDNERTRYFDMCITTAAYPKVKNQGIQEVRSMKPKHDSTSHYRSALEYLSLGLENFVDRPRKAFDKFKPKEVFVRRRTMGY